MTYLDAAHTILTQAGQPLHYAEITRLALDQGLIVPTGLTPEATMASRLYTDTKEEDSQFARLGKGFFELARRQPGGLDAQVSQITHSTRERLRDLLQSMPAQRFEALIVELLLQMGFDENTVKITPFHGDGDIDVTGIYRAAGLTEVNAAVYFTLGTTHYNGFGQQRILPVRRVAVSVPVSIRCSSARRAPNLKYTEVNARSRSSAGSAMCKPPLSPKCAALCGCISRASSSPPATSLPAHVNKTRIGLIDGDQLLDLLIKHRIGVTEKTLTVLVLDDDWWDELLAPAHQTLATTAAKSITQTKTLVDSPSIEDPTHKAQPGPTQPRHKIPKPKPVFYTLFGQNRPVASWHALIVDVCALLARPHAATFADHAVKLRGRKRQYIAPSPEGMINPAAMPGTTLWVETNQSSDSAEKFVRRLLAHFGEDLGEFTVTSM